MNRKILKPIKISAIAVGALIAVFLAVVTIAVNFVFTPSRLTPVVLRVANQSMNARLDMESVELTFFSTFPRFGLKLTDGSLVSKTIRDTLWERTDSLVSFKKCVVVINPIDYLKDKKISLYYLGLEDASVYAFKNKEGVANWDIVAADTTAVEDTAGQERPDISEININRVAFKRTNVVFDDRDTRLYARVTDADLNLKASLRKGHSDLALDFKNRNIIFWQDGRLLLRRMATELKTNLDLNRQTRTLTLKDTRLSVNGVALDVDGTIRRDTVNHAAAVDLTYGLHAPSLETVLRMIPRSIMKDTKVAAKGEVKVAGTLKGLYGKQQMPEITLKVQVNDASAKYEGLPYGIDLLSADFAGFIDLMKKKPSYADLKIFRFQGAHTDILADAKIEDLLGDPDITFNTKSSIDLTSLSQAFPLQPGVTLGGKVDADLNLRCRLSALQKQDLGRLKLKGKLDMKQMVLKDTTHNFSFTGDASLAFIGNEVLGAKMEINKIALTSSQINSKIDKLTARIKSTNPQDTTRIVDMECKLELEQLKGEMTDSLGVFCRKTNATIRIQPGKVNPAMPKVALSMKADTLFCRMGAMRMGMDKGGFAITAEKVRDSVWDPKGIIGFNRLRVKTPEFALPIIFRKTQVTVGNRSIKLKNATMRIGRSNLTASGAVYNLYEAMKKHTLLRANLSINSRNLDCNQLINSLNFPEDSLAVETDTTDTAPLELFVIPKNIDFELQTNLKRVKYGKMVFENVHVAVDVRNQAVHLKKLTMRGLDADIDATLVYRARRKSRGYAGFDFKLHKINIGKLVDFIPSLDTIVPMLRSFQGMVNFEAAAETSLDSNLNVRIPTLRSAVHIKGDSLVLMDGETFAEISKMLRFKNKERNVFDSISVNLTVDDGKVTVYPFLLQIDRYQAAVGGTQGLDMNFDYHISILKWPIPLLKIGVNVTGNAADLDHVKIKLGKAKYKDAVTPVEIRRIDSTRINMGERIVNDFQKVMIRGNRKMPALAE